MTKIHISVLALLAAAATLCAAEQAQSTATPPAPAPAKSTTTAKPATTAKKAAPSAASKKPALPVGLPVGAKEIEPFFWRYVDPKGVAWIYHTTPFGMVHQEETAEFRAEHEATAAGRRAPESSSAATTVVEKGDELQFARHTPFGNSVWTKKKTDLTDEEAGIWVKAQAAAAAGQQAAKQ